MGLSRTKSWWVHFKREENQRHKCKMESIVKVNIGGSVPRFFSGLSLTDIIQYFVFYVAS